MTVVARKPEPYNDKMKKLFYALCLGVILSACSIQPAEEKYTVKDAQYLHDCQKELTDIIVYDIFTPPVASRVYVYPMLAAYETARFAQPDSKSITANLHGFGPIPEPEAGKEYDF